MSTVLTEWPWWARVVVLAIAGVAFVWWFRRDLKKSDIQGSKLDPNLQWDTAPDDALTKVYEYVVAVSDTTIEWYRKQRRPKRQLGFLLRLSALVLTVGAGLVPLLSRLDPKLSTLMIAVAGLFVSIDLFAGPIESGSASPADA